MNSQPISTQQSSTSPISPEAVSEKRGRSLFFPILSFIILSLLTTTGYLAYQNMQLIKELRALKEDYTYPPTSPTPTPRVDVASWLTYTNQEYGFTIKHPAEFKEMHDKSGWPNALVLLSRINRQTYDLPIELWGSEAQYKQKYAAYLQSRPDSIKAYRLSSGKYITLIDMNDDPLVTQIIASFTVDQPSQNSATQRKYSCPANGWVDCMPRIGEQSNDCTPEAMSWYKANCANFQGGAY